MPQFYKRKTERANKTPPDIMRRAADEVENGKSLRSVAKDYNIDKMTLHRFIKKRQKDNNAVTGYAAVAQAHYIFTPEMEKDLGDHIKLLSDMFFGLSLEKCCKLAYEFASRNELKMPEPWKENRKAGKSWWLGFKKRQNLTIRSPEATSLGRATAFNRHTTGEFYDNLARVMDEHHFKPEDIHNLDETGCTTVQKPRDIITEKGKKQVGSATSAERGELVTVVYTISASGNVLPPMFIFPRVNFRDHFIRGGPPGCVGQANKSGWINEELFLFYLGHLIQHTRCSMERKILLILDNHETHISLRAIELARASGIVMLTIPPHTSHRLQPLDRSVYGPFKSAYNRAMDAWLRNNPLKTVTIYEIPSLVTEAQLSAMTPRNILSGFQSTGIFPYNRDLFTDVDFAPAIVSDRPIQETTEVPTETSRPASPISNVPQISMTENDSIHLRQPTTSTSSQSSSGTSSPVPDKAPEKHYISPSEIHGLPKAGPRKTKRSRKKGKTMILTSTPVRDEISAQQQKKKNKSAAKKSLFKKKKSIPVAVSDSSSEEDDVVYNDDSDEDGSSDDAIIEGDYVIVKVAGKSRVVNYIARIDVVSSGEYEGIFLQKVSGRVTAEKVEDMVFIPNEEDQASFPADDIICKLPPPKIVGGSARRSNQLKFDYNLNGWDLC